jgi:hypothetical protein
VIPPVIPPAPCKVHQWFHSDSTSDSTCTVQIPPVIPVMSYPHYTCLHRIIRPVIDVQCYLRNMARCNTMTRMTNNKKGLLSSMRKLSWCNPSPTPLKQEKLNQFAPAHAVLPWKEKVGQNCKVWKFSFRDWVKVWQLRHEPSECRPSICAPSHTSTKYCIESE